MILHNIHKCQLCLKGRFRHKVINILCIIFIGIRKIWNIFMDTEANPECCQ
eukprot:UN07100